MKYKESFPYFFVLVLILILSCVGCIPNKSALSKLSQGEYLVTYSREFAKPSRLVIYQGNGTKLEDMYLQNGQALHDSIKSDEGYLFVSKRINTHYQIDNSGSITQINFAPDKYAADSHTGTFFSVYSQGWLIAAMNIGKTVSGYSTEIIYQLGLNGKQKRLPLNLGIVDSATVIDNVLFVHYMSTNSTANDPNSVDFRRYSGIYAFDLKTSEEIFHVTLPNNSLAVLSRTPMITYYNYLLLCGDSRSFPGAQENNPPTLGIFDSHNGTLIREVFFNENFLPASLYIYQRNIYIMSTDGRIKVLNDKFDIIKEFALADNALDNFPDKRAFIYKTLLLNSELHVIYRFSPDKQNYQCPATIHIYDVETGALKRVTDLKLEGEASWWAEELEVQLIPK